MLGRLFSVRPQANLSMAARDPSAGGQVVYVGNLQQGATDHLERKMAILKAGGAKLDHRPRYTDKWEAAIQRLVHEGLLSEHIEYGGFAQARTYSYTLSRAGERVVEKLRGEEQVNAP